MSRVVLSETYYISRPHHHMIHAPDCITLLQFAHCNGLENAEVPCSPRARGWEAFPAAGLGEGPLTLSGVAPAMGNLPVGKA